MKIFSKLFSSKKPYKISITKTFCKKHGLVPNFYIQCQDKEYPACGHCWGELLSKHCHQETTVLEQECI